MVRVFAGFAMIGLVACTNGSTPSRAAPTAAPSPSPSPGAELPVDPWAAAQALHAPDAATLASRLLRADAALREAGASEGDVASAARIEQAAHRQLAANPDWTDVVLPRLPPGLQEAVRENVEAGIALRRLTPPRETMPDWRIVQPAAAGDLRSFYDQAHEAFGVPWHVLAAINLVETRMGRIRGLSTAGARGPMQFLPRTWDAYGEGDIDDPRDSILAAGRFLAAHGAPENLSRALFRYNPSDHYVRAILLYSERMRDDPVAFRAYYHWEVYIRTTHGDALLPVGWDG